MYDYLFCVDCYLPFAFRGKAQAGAQTVCLHGKGHEEHIHHAHTFPIFQVCLVYLLFS